jgi:OOP family OmpA-OmpF porin
LAAYLIANPARQVVLVGHTDAVGSLESNITLSKRRAASVEARLEDEYGVPSAQLSADGVGFLSPLVSNLTEDGRNRNRRVEAVLISTE